MTEPAPDFSFVLLHVDSPAASAIFYERLLRRPPLEASPTFVMFPLREGVMLGLWARATVAPASAGTAGSSEIAFTVGAPAQVDALAEVWMAHGVRIAQAPVDLDFGRAFTALDPDDHRLRVFAPA